MSLTSRWPAACGAAMVAALAIGPVAWSDGQSDAGFGDNGQVFRPATEGRALASPDGAALLALATRQRGEVHILRFDADGRSGTEASFAMPGSTMPTGLAFSGTRQIVSGVTSQQDQTPSTAPPETRAASVFLAAMRPDGSLESSFGDGGKVVTALGQTARAHAATTVVQTDGKIVAVVNRSDGDNYDNPRVQLLRYNANGSPDGSWGTNGVVTTDFDGYYLSAGPPALQADGKVVLAGRHVQSLVAMRYLSDGKLDPSFGSGG